MSLVGVSLEGSLSEFGGKLECPSKFGGSSSEFGGSEFRGEFE